MDWLFELLRRQPFVALLIGAWLVGMVSNALKAQKKAKERREAQLRPTKVSAPEATAAPTVKQAAAAKGPGEVVSSMGTGQRAQLPSRRTAPASMRGSKKAEAAWPEPKSAPAQAGPAPAKKATSPDEIAAEMRRIFGLDSKPTPKVEPQPPRHEPVRVEPELVDPRSVRVRSSEPALRSSVDSHVGESARDRHLQKTKVGQTRGNRGAIGNLGGRVQTTRKKRTHSARRFPMDDMKRIIVMNEILSPPVTMREPGNNPPHAT